MKPFKILTLTFTAAALAFCAPAQTSDDKPSVTLARTNSIKATVADIDHDKREITLKGPEGNSMKFKVDERVKNFGQVKKGDEVRMGYYESIALSVRKPGDPLPATGRSRAMITREPGQKPGGVAVDTADITATVEAIDRDKREVTLKSPRGNVVTVKVDPSVGNLERIKTGDEIEATYTEALAISVDKPEP